MTQRPKPKPKPKPRREPALPAPQPIGDGDPLADARIRPLLQRYCRLAGVKQAALGPDHSELRLPQAERPFFRDRESLRLAFSVDALERDPDAEIAVLGSPFLSQLLDRKIKLFELVVGELDLILGEFGGAHTFEGRLADEWLASENEEDEIGRASCRKRV